MIMVGMFILWCSRASEMSDNRSSGAVVEDEGTMMMVKVKDNHCGKTQMSGAHVWHMSHRRDLMLEALKLAIQCTRACTYLRCAREQQAWPDEYGCVLWPNFFWITSTSFQMKERWYAIHALAMKYVVKDWNDSVVSHTHLALVLLYDGALLSWFLSPTSRLAQVILRASMLTELVIVREWFHDTAPIQEAATGYWSFKSTCWCRARESNHGRSRSAGPRRDDKKWGTFSFQWRGVDHIHPN